MHGLPSPGVATHWPTRPGLMQPLTPPPLLPTSTGATPFPPCAIPLRALPHDAASSTVSDTNQLVLPAAASRTRISTPVWLGCAPSSANSGNAAGDPLTEVVDAGDGIDWSLAGPVITPAENAHPSHDPVPLCQPRFELPHPIAPFLHDTAYGNAPIPHSAAHWSHFRGAPPCLHPPAPTYSVPSLGCLSDARSPSITAILSHAAGSAATFPTGAAKTKRLPLTRAPASLVHAPAPVVSTLTPPIHAAPAGSALPPLPISDEPDPLVAVLAALHGGTLEKVNPCPAPPPAEGSSKRPALFRPKVPVPMPATPWYSTSEFWGPWRPVATLYDPEGRAVPVEAHIDTPSAFVFDSELDSWLTYKRNYISLSITLSLPLDVALSSLRLSPSPSPSPSPSGSAPATPIDHLEATLSARAYPRGTPVDLLQFDARRKAQTAIPVAPAVLAPVEPPAGELDAVEADMEREEEEDIPVLDAEVESADDTPAPSPQPAAEEAHRPRQRPRPLGQPHRATLKRVQFRSSTSNRAPRRSPSVPSVPASAADGKSTPHFLLRCTLSAVLGSSAGAGGAVRVKLGGWDSALLCVRGRSPANFGGQNGRRGESAAGEKSSSRRGRKRGRGAGEASQEMESEGEGERVAGSAKRAKVGGANGGVVTRAAAARQLDNSSEKGKKRQALEVTPEGDLVV